MKTRLIRPAYWTNADLHNGHIRADAREFYIGLWMLADDAGYVPWDVDRVGAELYPYETSAWRRRHLPRWVEELGQHVQLLACGRHLLVPTLSKYNKPPIPSYQHRRAHELCLQRAQAGTTNDDVAEARATDGKLAEARATSGVRGRVRGRGEGEGEGVERGRRRGGLTDTEATSGLGEKILAALDGGKAP